MRIVLKLMIILLCTFILAVGFVIATDYKPPTELVIEVDNRNEILLDESEMLTVTTMNVGFGGLDKDQDFFMDGGSGSKSTSLEKTTENINKAIEFMASNDADVYLLQEVDIDSHRSFYFNERKHIEEELAQYNSVGTTYYKVPFVPVPFNEPVGKVEMELLTLSKGQLDSTIRYDLPNESKVPEKYFLLDRCMMETIIPLRNGKNIVLLNVHLSAYDSDGSVKKEQLEWIENYITQADLEDNYYVFGGDWNLVLKELSEENKDELRYYWIEKPSDFKSGGFEWFYDASVNTVRELDAPYQKGKSYEQVIDGFLVSSNLEIISVEGHDLGFDFSDHNPVSLKIRFK